MRLHSLWLVLVVSLIVAGCSGSGVVGVPQLNTVLNTHTDASGEAAADTSAGTAYDIQSVEARRIDNTPFGSYDTLRTDIIFAAPPVLPPAGEFANDGTELVFRVYFDTDQDDATGGWWNGMCGDDQGGADFVVNASLASDVPGGTTLPAPVARLASGNYEVVNDTGKTGEASVTVVGNTLQVSVPLSALGNDNGVTNMSVRVGNASDVTSDCAPAAAGTIPTNR